MCLLLSHSIAGTGKAYPAKAKTLLEILVEELPKRGGWPNGATDARQDKDGEICFSGHDRVSDDFHYGQLAADAIHNERNTRLVEVTRDQYEAALAASQVANSRANDDRFDKLLEISKIRAVSAWDKLESLGYFYDGAQWNQARVNVEDDLNDCIGPAPENITEIRGDLLEVLSSTGLEVKLNNAIKVANAIIDAGYRKQ